MCKPIFFFGRKIINKRNTIGLCTERWKALIINRRKAIGLST
jgi:hypothetical protein